MKKKIILLTLIPVFILIVAFGISGIILSRADSDGFVVSDGVLVSYSGEATSIVIPTTVKTIGQEAFMGNPLITQVTIDGNVYSIEARAFANCKNLQTVTIGDSLVSMGNSVFDGCSNLSSVTIGKGLENLGDGVFSGCDTLAGISLSTPDFICEDGALYSSDKTELYQWLSGYYANVYKMPDSITKIHRYSFWGADSLEEVECSAALSEIGDYAFANATGLKSIIINSPVRKIGLGAFDTCSSLLQVSAPVSLTNISENAFSGVGSDLIFICDENSYTSEWALEHGFLTSSYSVVTVEAIEKPAVTTSATSTASSNSVMDPFTELNASVNQGLYSLGSEEGPEGETACDTKVVSDRAFVSLDGISVVNGSGNDEEEYNITIVDSFSHYNDLSISEYEFDPEVTAIGKLSFARSALESIVIPEGITDIGYAAFYHCDKLTEVTIPSTVTNIEKYAFDYTPWYESWLNDENADDFLIVGDGVLIGYKGSETDPVLPESVKHISEGVF